MTPTIYLALTHDWELRGDGSGDIEEIQFAPLRRLLGIYERAGARTTFLPDVLQQVTFRKFAADHSELQTLADSWDEHAREAFRQGHDIQLHLHSQWSDAVYRESKWQLQGEWSMLKYDREHVRAMLADTKEYLESLIRPLNSEYCCLAFRASALALAPSTHLLTTLADFGIEIDVSVAAGFFLRNQTLQLDYRECEEPFLPYYPTMDDARRVSSQPTPIVCLPLNHFFGSRREVTKQNLALAGERLRRNKVAAQAVARPQLDTDSTGVARLYEKLIEPALHRKYFVSDTGRLNYALMREMLAQIRQRARASGWSKVPVVVTNHPKDIRDWDGLEKFVKDLANANDIEFVTLTEIAKRLQSGEFQVRTSAEARTQ